MCICIYMPIYIDIFMYVYIQGEYCIRVREGSGERDVCRMFAFTYFMHLFIYIHIFIYAYVLICKSNTYMFV